MNLSILKENLKQGIFIVSHVAGKNINLPILNNILVDVKKEGVRMVATNLEIGITNYIRGKVGDECEFTIDSKIFSDYINLLPNKKIDLEKIENNLKIKCENYKTKIRIEPVEDFPLIPQVEKKNKRTAKIKDFKKALSKVIFATSGSETRIELSGVLFTFNNNKLILAATDSYRLAEKEVEITQENSSENEEKIIIPAKTIQELLRILSGITDDEIKNNDEINFYINDNQILFTINTVELVSRLIEGQYPDYKQIIPTKSKTIATINRSEFIRAVKTSAIFSKTGINDINLDFPKGKNKLVISSTSGNTGENIVEVDAQVKGDDNGVIVNFQYLLDGLNNIDEEIVKVEVMDNNTPVIIKPIKEESYLYIVMPIKQ